MFGSCGFARFHAAASLNGAGRGLVSGRRQAFAGSASRHRRHALHRLVGLIVAAASMPVFAQEYRFSWGPHQHKVHGPAMLPTRQTFPGVYCFDLPQSLDPRETSFGMLNGNAITWAEYPANDAITVFVVSSTLPQGRAPVDDIQALFAVDLESQERIGDRQRVSVEQGESRWGTTIHLKMKNITLATSDGVFPLTLGFYAERDEAPYTRSTHRLFARGGHRFEIAAVGIPPSPGDPKSEDATWTKLERLADQVTDSLQRCTEREFPVDPESALTPISGESGKSP